MSLTAVLLLLAMVAVSGAAILAAILAALRPKPIPAVVPVRAQYGRPRRPR